MPQDIGNAVGVYRKVGASLSKDQGKVSSKWECCWTMGRISTNGGLKEAFQVQEVITNKKREHGTPGL